MLLNLILLLTVVPILELVVILQVHDAVAARWGTGTGLLVTVGSIVLTGVLGALLARQQGMGVLRTLRESTSRGELPGQALLDGAMVLVGAVLLLTPGFLTDALGFSLLIPITRAFYRNGLLRWLGHKIKQGEFGVHISGPHSARGPSAEKNDVIIETTAHPSERTDARPDEAENDDG